ncbi:hypothetical protein GHT06_013458 [Daphnia sinensis]|uniref:Uncharacterized protein n=1 Tax=Daphnia sinensis TaxID=1820382 RepID=A0AAD5LB59_9CRUS|nr:hypothetical protein GHT06_013458 [Daphnia sinensis]
MRNLTFIALYIAYTTKKLISSDCDLGHSSFHRLEFTMLRGFLIKYDILTDFSRTFGFRNRYPF